MEYISSELLSNFFVDIQGNQRHYRDCLKNSPFAADAVPESIAQSQMPQCAPGSTSALREAVEDSAIPLETVAVTQCSQHLTPVSSRSAFFHRRKPKQSGLEHRKVLGLSLGINVVLVSILCVMAIAWGTEKKTVSVDICRTKDCLESAHRLISAVDEQVDPCEDFYQFACGNWMREHIPDEREMIASQFSQAKKKIRTEVQDMLESRGEPDDSLPVQQVRELYKACTATDVIESLGVSPLIEALEMLGLPASLPSSNTTENFNLTKTLAMIQYHLTISDLIVTVGFGVHPQNESRKTLLLYPPRRPRVFIGLYGESVVGPDPQDFMKLKKRSASNFVEDELRYRSTAIETFENLRDGKQRMEVSELRAAAMKTLVLEAEISRKQDLSGLYRIMTLSELQNETVGYLQFLKSEDIRNQIDWESFVRTLLKDVGVVREEFWNPILVRDPKYFQQLATILAKTKTESIQRLIWWKVVEHLMVFSTQALRRLRYMKAGDYRIVSRTDECLQVIDKTMPMAVAYKIATQPKMNHTRQRVGEMMSDVRAAFMSLVRKADWMDKETTNHALSKVRAMSLVIAYPDFFVARGYIEDQYKGVTIKRCEYLKSVLSVFTAEANRVLGSLDSAIDFRNEIISPFVINAFNVVNQNSVVIPTGILHSPFYGLGLEVLNYAAIGTILGHELMHSFDNNGRLYDKNGQKRNWWSNSTTNEFVAREQCFVEQYKNYNVGGRSVDSRRTLGENIADNGGLREAIQAYRKYTLRKGREPKLPGLEKLTHEQLFFLTFANIWCTRTTELADLLLSRDAHCPSKYRVIGTLSNMEEFSEAWQCPAGSPMNHKEKCVLW